MKLLEFIAGLLVFIVIPGLGIIVLSQKVEHSTRTEKEITRVTVTDTTAFADQVLSLIMDLRLEHPYVVFAQARLESGNFNSQIFRENNNLFGMKMPWRRATFASGVNRGHAIYSTWKHSVYDYALWQSAYMRGLTQDQYLEKLSESYAEDSNYKHKLRKLL